MDNTNIMGMDVPAFDLPDDVVFTGINGGKFYIKAAKPKIGGQSLLYNATDEKTGKACIAKIYSSDDNLTRNRMALTEFMTKNVDYKRSHIMPLLDYGRIEVRSIDNTRNENYIDILPVCVSIEKKLDFVTLRDKVIPGINKALHTAHNENWVHRDIKPENLFWLDGTLVVGDFGIARRLMQEYPYTHTRRRDGTHGYMAPEVMQGAYGIESDYYSMGLTIGTLFNGEHLFPLLYSGGDQAGIFIQLDKHKNIPVNENKNGAEHIKRLIYWLTRTSLSERIGYDEVCKWVDNTDFLKPLPSLDKVWRNSFNFNGKLCNNQIELTYAMASNWDAAIRYLYTGTIAAFFDREDQTLAMYARNIVEGFNSNGKIDSDSIMTKTNHDLGLSRFLHWLNNGGPLYWRGSTYKSTVEIAEIIHNGLPKVYTDISQMLQSKILSWKVKNDIKSVDSDKLTVVEEIDEMLKYPKLGYFYTMYRLIEDDALKTYDGLKTIDQIFSEMMKSANHFYIECKKIIDGDDRRLAFIAQCKGNAHKHILQLKESLLNNDTKFLDKVADILRSFEMLCDNPEKVRKFNYLYGPQSYLSWIRNNIDLYKFHGPDVNKLRDEIIAHQIGDYLPLAQQFEVNLSLTALIKEFKVKFQNNLQLAYLGLTENKGITSDSIDGYFHESFYGETVPVGFIRYINS